MSVLDSVIGRVRWYLHQISGEARWEEYVDRCRAAGETPMSRRDYERHRSDHRDTHPEGRCC